MPIVTINISLIATVPVVLFHFPYRVCSSILRTEAVDTSETSVPFKKLYGLTSQKSNFCVLSVSAVTCDIVCLFCSALFVPVVRNLCVVSHYPNSRRQSVSRRSHLFPLFLGKSFIYQHRHPLANNKLSAIMTSRTE